MRIFERLRAHRRKGASVERRLFEAITADLLNSLEEASAPPVVGLSLVRVKQGAQMELAPAQSRDGILG